MHKILILLLFFSLNQTFAQVRKGIYFPNMTHIKETGSLDDNGYPIGVWKYYSDPGIVDYIIDWDIHYFKKYYVTGEIREEGNFIPETGVHIGKWKFYLKDGTLIKQELYDKKGKIIKNTE